MAERVNVYVKAGYFDVGKAPTSEEDWDVNERWNDVPPEFVSELQDVLHDAQGKLIALGRKVREAKVAGRGGGDRGK